MFSALRGNIRRNTMSSMFDFDDSVNLAFDAKIAGKKLVTAKHELLTKTGEFLFLAHSEKELALRMQMVEEDIERIAYRKLANVSDSKAKLVRAAYEEWSLRHASCELCKTAAPLNYQEPSLGVSVDTGTGKLSPVLRPGGSKSNGKCDGCGVFIGPRGELGGPAYIQDPSLHPIMDGIDGAGMIETSKIDVSKLPKGTPSYCKPCAIEKIKSTPIPSHEITTASKFATINWQEAGQHSVNSFSGGFCHGCGTAIAQVGAQAAVAGWNNHQQKKQQQTASGTVGTNASKIAGDGLGRVMKDTAEGWAAGTVLPGIGNGTGAAIGMGLGLAHAAKDLFCNGCKSNPSQIGCASCKNSLHN